MKSLDLTPVPKNPALTVSYISFQNFFIEILIRIFIFSFVTQKIHYLCEIFKG